MQRRNLHARLAEALAAASAVGPTRSAVAPSASAVGPAVSAVGPTRSAVGPAVSAVGPMRSAVAPAASAVGSTQSAVAPAASAVGPTRSAVAPAALAVGPMRSAVAPAAHVVPAAIVAYHWSQSCRLGDGRSLDPMELPRVLKVGCCSEFPFYPVSPLFFCLQVFIVLSYLHFNLLNFSSTKKGMQGGSSTGKEMVATTMLSHC